MPPKDVLNVSTEVIHTIPKRDEPFNRNYWLGVEVTVKPASRLMSYILLYYNVVYSAVDYYSGVIHYTSNPSDTATSSRSHDRSNPRGSPAS